ncbi:MAG: hypothetical protein R3C99_15905 [Pirellulaceae bacterium]
MANEPFMEPPDRPQSDLHGNHTWRCGWNDKIKICYQQLRHNGKPAKVAIVAGMRKLVTSCYHG